jgi:subtilisin family serine protease
MWRILLSFFLISNMCLPALSGATGVKPKTAPLLPPPEPLEQAAPAPLATEAYRVLEEHFPKLNGGEDPPFYQDPRPAPADSAAVPVAILDTGIDYLHPMLERFLWVNPRPTQGDLHGWDFVSNDPFPYDYYAEISQEHINQVMDQMDQSLGDIWWVKLLFGLPLKVYLLTQISIIQQMTTGHGTSVSDVMLTACGNDCRVMPLRAFSPFSPTEHIIPAIKYAIHNGARVINMSFILKVPNLVKNKRIDFIQDFHEIIVNSPNTLFVAAAGNNGTHLTEDVCLIPACFSAQNLITVGATNNQGELASFSNYGDEMVNVYAPGVSILAAHPGGGAKSTDGTSFSAPFISGLAGALFAKHPEWTGQQMRDYILSKVMMKQTFKPNASQHPAEREEPITIPVILNREQILQNP